MRAASWSVWLLPLALVSATILLIGTVRDRSRQVARLPHLEAVAGGNFPLIVHAAEQRGLPQTIPARPTRILLANATLVDLASALVPAERIVALPEQALTWSRLVDVDEGFRAKATYRELDAERVLAYRPDLVISSSFNTSFGGDWARRAGIPILSLPHPESIAELFEILELLGQSLDARVEAAALQHSLTERLRELARSGAPRRGLRALIYSNYGAGGWTAGPGTLADELITWTGMHNAAAQAGLRGSTRCTFEDIVVADPDVIVVPGRFGEQDGATFEVLQHEASLAGVRAIRRGFIVRLHPRLFSAGSQEIVTAAERLAGAVDELLARERSGSRGLHDATSRESEPAEDRR